MVALLCTKMKKLIQVSVLGYFASVKGLKRIYHSVIYIVFFALLCEVSMVRADNTMTLTFTAKRAAPACVLTSDAGSTLSLPGVAATYFTGPDMTSQSGKGFTLTLSGCTASATGADNTKIAIWGDRDDVAGDYAFRTGSTSDSTGIGFALQFNTTTFSSDNNHWVKASGTADMTTPEKAFKVTVAGLQQGDVPDGKTMGFWVGLTNKGVTTPVAPGGLKANMHFNVVFE